MGQCYSKRSAEAFGPPAIVPAGSAPKRFMVPDSTENDSDDENPTTTTTATTTEQTPQIEPERIMKRNIRKKKTPLVSTRNLQTTVIREDSALDAPSDEESIVRPPVPRHSKKPPIGRLSPVKLKQQTSSSTNPNSIQIHDYPLNPADTISKSALSNFQKLKLQVAVSEQQKQKHYKLQKVEKQLRDEQEYNALWNEYKHIQNIVKSDTTPQTQQNVKSEEAIDNAAVKSTRKRSSKNYHNSNNSNVGSQSVGAEPREPRSTTKERELPAKSSSSAQSALNGRKKSATKRNNNSAAGVNEIADVDQPIAQESPTGHSWRNQVSSAVSVGSWWGRRSHKSVEYDMDAPVVPAVKDGKASSSGSVRSWMSRGRHQPERTNNSLPQYEMEDEKPTSIEKKKTSSGSSVRSRLSNTRKKKKPVTTTAKEEKIPKSLKKSRRPPRSPDKAPRPIVQTFEYDLQDDFCVTASTSVHSRRSGRSYRSRGSGRTQGSKNNKGCTPKRRGRSDSDSFDLKETRTWFFDFQETFPDDESVGSDNSQAALSLLSESSMEAQRRLYAEKRRQRKERKNNKNSTVKSKPSDSKKQRVANKGPKSYQSGNYTDGGSEASSIVSNDYGPVRRSTGTQCSTPVDDTKDRPNRSFTNLEVEFLTPPSDSNRSEDKYDESFVSDLDDDTASYASLNDFRSQQNRPSVDMNEVLQRRLDIERRLRELAADDDPDTIEPVKTTTLLAGDFMPTNDDVAVISPGISPEDRGTKGTSLLQALAGYLSPGQAGDVRSNMSSKNLFGDDDKEKTDLVVIHEVTSEENAPTPVQDLSGEFLKLKVDMAESAKRLVANKISKSPNVPSSQVLLRSIGKQKAAVIESDVDESFESAREGFPLPYLRTKQVMPGPTTLNDSLVVNESIDGGDSLDGSTRPLVQTSYQGTPIPVVSPESVPKDYSPMLPNNSVDYCNSCADDRVVAKLLSASRDSELLDDARDTLLLADQVDADVQNVLERYRSSQ